MKTLEMTPKTVVVYCQVAFVCFVLLLVSVIASVVVDLVTGATPWALLIASAVLAAVFAVAASRVDKHNRSLESWHNTKEVSALFD